MAAEDLVVHISRDSIAYLESLSSKLAALSARLSSDPGFLRLAEALNTTAARAFYGPKTEISRQARSLGSPPVTIVIRSLTTTVVRTLDSDANGAYGILASVDTSRGIKPYILSYTSGVTGRSRRMYTSGKLYRSFKLRHKVDAGGQTVRIIGFAPRGKQLVENLHGRSAATYVTILHTPKAMISPGPAIPKRGQGRGGTSDRVERIINWAQMKGIGPFSRESKGKVKHDEWARTAFAIIQKWQKDGGIRPERVWNSWMNTQFPVIERNLATVAERLVEHLWPEIFKDVVRR
jgi:hypothetical protein